MVSQRLRHRIFPLLTGGPVIAFLTAILCSAQIGQERLDLSGEWPVYRGNIDWTVNRRPATWRRYASRTIGPV